MTSEAEERHALLRDLRARYANLERQASEIAKLHAALDAAAPADPTVKLWSEKLLLESLSQTYAHRYLDSEASEALSNWGISRRLLNILHRQGVYRSEHLTERAEWQFRAMQGLGDAGMRELKQVMRERGLAFAERPIA